MSKDNRNPHNRTMPEVQLISNEEYEKSMNRLMDIQNAANAAIKSINELKALIAITF